MKTKEEWRAYHRAWSKRNRASRRKSEYAWRKKWRKENPDAAREHDRIKQAKRRARKPAHIRTVRRAWYRKEDVVRRRQQRLRNETPEDKERRSYVMWKSHIKGKYGITEADYMHKLAEQGNVCAVCRGIHKGLYASRRLSVDHNHRTAKVRGLLCNECNKALGCLGENADRIEALKQYVIKWSL